MKKNLAVTLKFIILSTALLSGSAVVAQGESVAPVSVSPSALTKCDKPVIGDITWDVSPSKEPQVDILLVTKDNKELLFASGGPKGTAKTGPWLVSGVSFKLKSKSGKLLAETKVVELPCIGNPASETPKKKGLW
jgi:hypothetical protein